MRLLGGCTIGRVAVTMGGLPAVFPVNFVLVDGDIVFRTGEGTKLAAALRHAVVGFEVDSIDQTYHQGWSVLALGRAEEITDESDLGAIERAPLAPWVQGRRDHVVRIHPEFVSGRRISGTPV
jgi:uncharacterized protein